MVDFFKRTYCFKKIKEEELYTHYIARGFHKKRLKDKHNPPTVYYISHKYYILNKIDKKSQHIHKWYCLYWISAQSSQDHSIKAYIINESRANIISPQRWLEESSLRPLLSHTVEAHLFRREDLHCYRFPEWVMSSAENNHQSDCIEMWSHVIMRALTKRTRKLWLIWIQAEFSRQTEFAKAA